ncbi:uncharacterized protein LOC133791504 [Humulus lupulus]|uniref:uncharacterized protein LOC133791504 n=1 Tax=Humulus lupulus TaxID=3486 RepID=UPI002B411F1F|nr:uncharacterized protein LOC133791504 [Humulus lupulus]
MAKTTRKTGQTSGNAPTHPPPQGVVEDETQVELEEEEMDYETLRTTLIQREIDRQHQELNEQQADMDRRQRDATAALEEAIQLARGQPAPASQLDQPPSTHPQQNPQLDHPQHYHNSPQPANPQRPEQPPTAQQDRSFQDPEQQPSYRAGQDNPQQQRQNRWLTSCALARTRWPRFETDVAA